MPAASTFVCSPGHCPLENPFPVSRTLLLGKPASGFKYSSFSSAEPGQISLPDPWNGATLYIFSLSATTKLYHNIFPLCSLQRSDFMRFPRTFLNRLNDNRLFVILTSIYADDIIALYVIEVAYLKSIRFDAAECRGRRGERDIRRKEGISAFFFLGMNRTGLWLSSSDGALSADTYTMNHDRRLHSGNGFYAPGGSASSECQAAPFRRRIFFVSRHCSHTLMHLSHRYECTDINALT